ncbi:hypothetical protein HK101_000747 [Irineochytrium annulatum]|nr:hypothetical protein HK101_000747 [Irineochytrium annulatum]
MNIVIELLKAIWEDLKEIHEAGMKSYRAAERRIAAAEKKRKTTNNTNERCADAAAEQAVQKRTASNRHIIVDKAHDKAKNIEDHDVKIAGAVTNAIIDTKNRTATVAEDAYKTSETTIFESQALQDETSTTILRCIGGPFLLHHWTTRIRYFIATVSFQTDSKHHTIVNKAHDKTKNIRDHTIKIVGAATNAIVDTKDPTAAPAEDAYKTSETTIFASQAIENEARSPRSRSLRTPRASNAASEKSTQLLTQDAKSAELYDWGTAKAGEAMDTTADKSEVGADSSNAAAKIGHAQCKAGQAKERTKHNRNQGKAGNRNFADRSKQYFYQYA